MFANKAFGLTGDALTTNAHAATTTAKPVFIFARRRL